MGNSGASVPAIAGLAAGIAFVVAFSMLSGPPLSSALETRRIDLAIEGLRDAYPLGERVVFSVTAKGILDNACNRSSPSVVMRDEGTGRTIYWPHPFGFSTAMRCATDGIDRGWTFGEDVDKEIILEKPGRYSVIVSYEGSRIEKQFSIIQP